MRDVFAIGFIAIAAVAVTPKAMGGMLNAGDILQIVFSTSSPVCPSGPCDVLEMNPGEAGSFFASNNTATLFNGSTLLGTYFNTVCCLPAFRSPSSLSSPTSATVDFTAIDSGISNAIIDMSIGTGFLTWPGAPTPTLILGHASSPGFVLGGTGLQVTSVTILPAPEPSTFALLLGGLVFLGFRQFRACLLVNG